MLLETVVSFDQVQEARRLLRDLGISHWITDDLFKWQWWLLLVASVLPWVIWLKFFIDRVRIFEILTYGFVIQTISTTLDVIGADLLLWAYPDKLLPFVPPLFPADITVIPTSFMAVYQFFRTWTSYLWASIILAGLFSYIMEPLFVLGDLFQMNSWTHTYSFIGFCIISLLSRWIIIKILNMSKQN